MRSDMGPEKIPLSTFTRRIKQTQSKRKEMKNKIIPLAQSESPIQLKSAVPENGQKTPCNKQSSSESFQWPSIMLDYQNIKRVFPL